MKKYFSIALFLVFSAICCAQENDAINQNKTISDTAVSINGDTGNAIINTKPITLALDSPKNIRVILAKEEPAGTDWAKYILPIVTLFLGIFINRSIDWLNKRSSTIRNGERWVVELRTTEVLITQQMTDLIEFKDRLSLTELSIPEIKAMTNLKGDVFKSLDKNELTKFIEVKNSKPKYRQIFSTKAERENHYQEVVSISNYTHGHIAIMEHQFNLIGEKFHLYAKSTSEHVQSFNKHVQEFLAEYGMYNLNYEKEGINIFTDERTGPLSVLYASQIAPYMATGTYNPFKLRDDFFIPAITHLAGYRFEERTIPLAKCIRACLNDIAGIETATVHMTKNINIILERYSELLNSLPGLINDIIGKKNQHEKNNEKV